MACEWLKTNIYNEVVMCTTMYTLPTQRHKQATFAKNQHFISWQAFIQLLFLQLWNVFCTFTNKNHFTHGNEESWNTDILMMMVRSVENCNMLLYIAWSLLCLLEADGSSYSLVSLLSSGLGVSMGLGVVNFT